MIDRLPPGSILIAGALLVPLLRGRLQQAWLLLLTLLSGLHLLVFLPAGTQVALDLFDYQLMPIRVDKLSLVWGYIFHIAAFVSVVYALHVKDRVQHVSGLIYAGAAIGAVFAGDLITLFVYWELTAISSVFLIWASRNERAYRSGMRYLIIQVGSGVLLLTGILFHLRDSGSLAFESLRLVGAVDGDPGHRLIHDWLGLNSPGAVLILIAFGIKAAFPLLHNWLQDAYPEATVTGTVFLSAFTTKLAIYALARGFAGTEILIWIGAIMAGFPVFYAVIENDLRRVLAYSLNIQLGYMVVGIGIGTNLALNGTASYAFAHILYKALLFMSLGAVLMRTGTAKGSELGGLYKSMPWSTAFCILGGASIAFPLLNGFVTKSLIMTAAAIEHHPVVWLVLLFATSGGFLVSGIQVTYFAFFAQDSGKRVKEAPLNMLIAMGITALLCVGIGILPGLLYGILPFQTVVVDEVPIRMLDYHIYSTTHVITQYQLLLWTLLAFAVLIRTGTFPTGQRSTNVDSDWTYRKALPALASFVYVVVRRVRGWVVRESLARLDQFLAEVRRLSEPQGVFARTPSTGGMAIWAAVLLAVYLLLYYL